MITSMREFLRLETTAGLALVVAAAIANSPWSTHYAAWLATPVPLGIAPLILSQELSNRQSATLPVIGSLLSAVFACLWIVSLPRLTSRKPRHD